MKPQRQGSSVMNRPLCPHVLTLPEMPQKMVWWPALLIGDCDKNAAPHACPRFSFIQILSRPALSAPLFSRPFFSLTSRHTQLKGLATTCWRRQVSEAQQAERERIKFAVPANGSWQTLGREMTFYWSQRLHYLTIHSSSVPLGRH